MGSQSILQGIFPTQGSNPGLPHCRQILYQLSNQGSPRILEWHGDRHSDPPFAPPAWRPGPPAPPTRAGHAGGITGGGDGAGCTPPSLLPRSRLGEGGREGIESGGPGVGGSLVWKRAGGSAERAARGPAAELGGEGFRSRCGAQGGPDVQRGGEEIGRAHV